ncbi:unnamed protein product [Calicophoron daubneyi]|uniref:Serine/threonine-protein kinase ULK3 n=1 Tax=Calicophoron daubneyi TaxID=300641 RepID=A0AAV2T316_CALDB
MLDIPNYSLIRKLGSGSYGEVYLAKRKGSDDLLAIKVIAKTKLSKRGEDNLVSEISILKKLRHPHIVCMYDFSWDSSAVYLFMEYCPGGDLSQFLKQRKRLREDLVRHFLQQLALALYYLKKKNIIHMDIKPQNIMLTSPTNPVLKVTDFGFAQCHKDTIKMNELRGTLLYMAPEIYCEGIYHPSCDLWSVGVILYQCLFGFTPYGSADSASLKAKLLKDEPIKIPSSVPISPDCETLLRGLLKRHPDERLNHEEFFAHPFVDLKHAPSAESLDKALEHLERAYDYEKHGKLQNAYESYTRGLAHLVAAVEFEDSRAEKNELRLMAVKNFDRAEKLKSQLKKKSSVVRPPRPPFPDNLVTGPSTNTPEDLIRPTNISACAATKPGESTETRPLNNSSAPPIPPPPFLRQHKQPKPCKGKEKPSKSSGIISKLKSLWWGSNSKEETKDWRSPTDDSPPADQKITLSRPGKSLSLPPSHPHHPIEPDRCDPTDGQSSEPVDQPAAAIRETDDPSVAAESAKKPGLGIDNSCAVASKSGESPSSSVRSHDSESLEAETKPRVVDKWIRLKMLHAILDRTHSESVSTEEPVDELQASYIREQQLALVADSERLLELKSMCQETDVAYLDVVSRLDEFYTLFRMQEFEQAQANFEENFENCLSVVKADPNEARRSSFRRELKVVLDLVESIKPRLSSQQQQQERPSSQSSSFEVGEEPVPEAETSEGCSIS